MEIKLPNETFVHKEIYLPNAMYIAQPVGKLACIWFTLVNDKPACFILDIRDRQIHRKYPLDILKEESLKAVDMYHLIDNLGTFTQKNNHENIYGKKIIYFQDKKNYTLFIEFIQVIKKYFFKTNFKNSMNRHFFTSSTYFEDKFKKDKIKKLYPENFIHLSLDDILSNKNINNDENTKVYKKTISRISFPMYNNNNANLTATKKTRTLSSPISKSLFSNN